MTAEETMKFLVDFNAGRAVADYLRSAGYDVLFIFACTKMADCVYAKMR